MNSERLLSPMIGKTNTRAQRHCNRMIAVRGAFWEGGPIYPGARIEKKNHVQICVRRRLTEALDALEEIPRPEGDKLPLPGGQAIQAKSRISDKSAELRKHGYDVSLNGSHSLRQSIEIGVFASGPSVS